MKKIYLILYYLLASRLPMQPVPGYRIYYSIRYFFAKRILKKCGNGVIVKNKCYFGNGSRLSVGDRSQLGQNSRLNGAITIGSDVLMAPDVIIMATSHEYSNSSVPIINQGEAKEREVLIGDDVWVGARVIMLPGVSVGSHSIIGAGSVVTKSFPEYSIIAGNPARLIKSRLNGKDAR